MQKAGKEDEIIKAYVTHWQEFEYDRIQQRQALEVQVILCLIVIRLLTRVITISTWRSGQIKTARFTSRQPDSRK
jgi:hypothetical protein